MRIDIVAKKIASVAVAVVIALYVLSLIIGSSSFGLTMIKQSIESKAAMYYNQLVASGVSEAEAAKKAALYREKLASEYGLNTNTVVRAAKLMAKILTADLGFVVSDDVIRVVGKQPPVSVGYAVKIGALRTIALILLPYILAGITAVILGAFIAYRGGVLDGLAAGYAIAASSIPAWLAGALGIAFLGVAAGKIPVTYQFVAPLISSGNIVALLREAWFPYLVLFLVYLGIWMYSVRTMARRLKLEPWITLAYAKGLPLRALITRYYARPVLAGALSVIVLSLGMVFGTTIAMEPVIGWPGLGMIVYTAISSGDMITAIAGIWVVMILYAIFRIGLDILYVALEPRASR